jgi:uncharacterized membrane protein
MPPRRSALDWCLEAVSAVALLVAISDVAIHWSILPAKIPIHFGADGSPNGWGSKNSLIILLIATTSVAIVLTIAERYQRLINIPIEVDRDSPAIQILLRRMVIAIKAVITLTFVWIVDLTMRTAVGEAHGLGPMFLPVFTLGTLAPVIYYVFRLKRFAR